MTQHLPRLQVSANRRFLVTDSGAPFFWLGDTAWELFHRLDYDEADSYLEDRAARGFTIIQAVALAELDGLRTPNRYGHLPLVDEDPARPDVRGGMASDYWSFVDRVIDRAAEKGLYVALLPTWGVYVTSDAHSRVVDGIFNPVNAFTYGRFIGERYGDRSNLVWVLGGDRAPATSEARAIWRALARGIVHGIAGAEDYDAALMTYHTAGPGHVSDWLHDELWLDFTSAQSSHGNLVMSWKFIEKHWDRRPIKPMIDLESSYPDAYIPAAWMPPALRADHLSTGPATDDHARRAAYWAVFAGAFGHTYGHNSIWQMYAPPHAPVLEARLTWQEALDAPSARQMGYLRRLMESHPMLERVPDQSLLVDGAGEGAQHIRATRGAGYILVYSPTGRAFTLRLDVLSGSRLRASWFDPRSGQTLPPVEFARTATHAFAPPGEPAEGNDWVLIVEDVTSADGG